MKHAGKPAYVALSERSIGTPVARQLGASLVAHAQKRVLADIGLQRVYGRRAHERKAHKAHGKHEQRKTQRVAGDEKGRLPHV